MRAKLRGKANATLEGEGKKKSEVSDLATGDARAPPQRAGCVAPATREPASETSDARCADDATCQHRRRSVLPAGTQWRRCMERIVRRMRRRIRCVWDGEAAACSAVRCGAVRALALHTPAEGFECTDWARRARAGALRCGAASDAPPFRTPMQLARSCTMALASRVHLSAAVPHQRAKSEFPLAPRKEEKKECCSCRRGEAR